MQPKRLEPTLTVSFERDGGILRLGEASMTAVKSIGT
jgi:hypothetical protein